MSTPDPWHYMVNPPQSASEALMTLSDMAAHKYCWKQEDGSRISTVYCVACDLTNRVAAGLIDWDNDVRTTAT